MAMRESDELRRESIENALELIAKARENLADLFDQLEESIPETYDNRIAAVGRVIGAFIVDPAFQAQGLSANLLRSMKGKIVDVESDAGRLLLDLGDWPTYGVLSQGGWEKSLWPLCERVIEPGQVVFDIGAHVGIYTLLFARQVGSKGKVYAFEPMHYNVQLLRQMAALNGLERVVEVEEAAVSDKDGTIDIFSFSLEESPSPIYPGPSGMNLSVIEGGGYSRKSGTSVKTVTLDEYDIPNDLEVDFVKIDTEGAEWKIIQGAKNFLKRMTNISLLIEVHALDLQRADVSPSDLVGQIQELGFTCFGILQQGNKLETKRLGKREGWGGHGGHIFCTRKPDRFIQRLE